MLPSVRNPRPKSTSFLLIEQTAITLRALAQLLIDPYPVTHTALTHHADAGPLPTMLTLMLYSPSTRLCSP